MKQITNKWPAVQIRGKKLTHEQMLDVLLRTDESLTQFDYNWHGNNKPLHAWWISRLGISGLDKDKRSQLTEAVRNELDVVHCYYISNNLFQNAWVGGSDAWLWNDGSIFRFANVGKWPSTNELLEECKRLAQTFPFLDMVATVYDNEVSSDLFINEISVDEASWRKGNVDSEVANSTLFSIHINHGDAVYVDDTMSNLDDIADAVPASFNIENPNKSECYYTDELLEDLRNKLVAVIEKVRK